MLALDSHVHCGLTLTYERIRSLWQSADISGGSLFSPVEEIYDRYDRYFTDNLYYQKSRAKVHEYLLSLKLPNHFVYWFVWNDFALPPDGFSGIKWHRHSYEPEYNYGSKECHEFLEFVCRKKLPIIIEDELQNTLDLVQRIDNRTIVIIPHFGGLNGGYRQLKRTGLFEKPGIYVDTALAAPGEITDFAADYGVDRILFGSDYPFGDPAYERYKVERLFNAKQQEKVLGLNLLKLLS